MWICVSRFCMKAFGQFTNQIPEQKMKFHLPTVVEIDRIVFLPTARHSPETACPHELTTHTLAAFLESSQGQLFFACNCPIVGIFLARNELLSGTICCHPLELHEECACQTGSCWSETGKLTSFLFWKRRIKKRHFLLRLFCIHVHISNKTMKIHAVVYFIAGTTQKQVVQ